MAVAQIPDGVIQRILEDETAPIRFEQFCCGRLTGVDGRDDVGALRNPEGYKSRIGEILFPKSAAPVAAKPSGDNPTQ